MKGKFVVIEGIDGSGKTTVIKVLKKILERRKYKVKVTKEPTNGLVGRAIYEYIRKESKRDLIIEALLFAADRRWHNLKIIIPSLDIYDFVISDRYIFSSLAYQTVDDVVDEGFINEINKNIIMPNIAFFIDVPPEVSLRRLKRRLNIFEELGYLRKVYKKYKEIVEREMLIAVDGNKKPREIAENILKYLV